MTRADMIRSMTNEEMAKFLINCFDHSDCYYCKLCKRCTEMYEGYEPTCVDVYLAYLNEEV